VFGGRCWRHHHNAVILCRHLSRAERERIAADQDRRARRRLLELELARERRVAKAEAVRESAAAKAVRYLGEGRLIVTAIDARQVRATCRGSGAVYDVGWTAETGWTCTCPAFKRCSHVYALQAVTAR
jgi:hypothetical protein